MARWQVVNWEAAKLLGFDGPEDGRLVQAAKAPKRLGAGGFWVGGGRWGGVGFCGLQLFMEVWEGWGGGWFGGVEEGLRALRRG